MLTNGKLTEAELQKVFDEVIRLDTGTFGTTDQEKASTLLNSIPPEVALHVSESRRFYWASLRVAEEVGYNPMETLRVLNALADNERNPDHGTWDRNLSLIKGLPAEVLVEVGKSRFHYNQAFVLVCLSLLV